MSLVVETGAGRSRAVSFVALLPLQAASLDPAGALPGDEVTLAGSGFAEGVTVTVGGAAARVVSAEAGAVRFEMPSVAGRPGQPPRRRRVDRGAPHEGRSPLPGPRAARRRPSSPPRGVAGDLVRIRGAGFAAAADGNVVTFDGVPALVVAASPTEMAVVVPPPVRPQPETLAPVVVHAGGKTSSDGAGFPLQRLVEGTWVPRFLAGAVGEGGAKGQATVGHRDRARAAAVVEGRVAIGGGARAARGRRAERRRGPRARRPGRGLRGARGAGARRGPRRRPRPPRAGRRRRTPRPTRRRPACPGAAPRPRRSRSPGTGRRSSTTRW